MTVALLCPTLSSASSEGFNTVLQPVFRKHCVVCHGQNGAPSGNVNLHELGNSGDLTQNPELIADIVKALDTGIMPPNGVSPLASEKRRQVIAELKELLKVALESQTDFPRTPIRRMNRFQYANAVEDLFDLNVEVFALPERMLRDYDYFRPESGAMPAELKVGSRPLGKSQLIGKRLAGVAPFPQDLRAEHGFDNRGDHLTLSPLLLESFLKLSRSIVDSHDFNSETAGEWHRLFIQHPGIEDTAAAVRQQLNDFLNRAYRRPVSDELLDRYAQFAMQRIESGASFAEGMQAAVSAALASPRFLYLYEGAGASESPEPLDDYELASRLSFFLWGSIPDQELLDLASEGRLTDLGVLEHQASRMLTDARVKRFCDSFPTQWLQLERIVSSVPDRERFPDFYFAKFRASMHMMIEPLLLFETVLVENRSILELVDSNFSYRSELLEQWYRDGTQTKRIPPTAIPFRRVPVTDRRQGGVITNAAVMTMTSNPVRTQPITRGAWLATVIFNNPPDPPPANVPPLANEEASGDESNLTLREIFAAHREDPTCAGCHAKIDPLGFALENYGPTGVWRDNYRNGREVDSAGVLFGRHNFTNVIEFKDALLAEKELFARAFAGHLLAFALGRETTVSDEPAIDRIIEETSGQGFRLQAMLKQIVLSEPFRTKYNPIKPGKNSRKAD